MVARLSCRQPRPLGRASAGYVRGLRRIYPDRPTIVPSGCRRGRSDRSDRSASSGLRRRLDDDSEPFARSTAVRGADGQPCPLGRLCPEPVRLRVGPIVPTRPTSRWLSRSVLRPSRHSPPHRVALAVVVVCCRWLAPGRHRRRALPTPRPRARNRCSRRRTTSGAASAFQTLTRTHPQQPRYWTRLGTSFQLAGRWMTPSPHTDARSASGSAPVAMYNLATVFATRGQKDSAFHWLDQLVTRASYSNDKGSRPTRTSHRFASDPRFDALLERMRAVLRPCLTRKESRHVRLLGRRLGREEPTGPARRPELRAAAARGLRAVRELDRQPGRWRQESQQLQHATRNSGSSSGRTSTAG